MRAPFRSRPASRARTIMRSIDAFSERVPRVLHVGGGNGSTVIALLLAQQHLDGIVFDLPHLEGEATAAIELAELSARCRFVGGNFFESVPPDADVYVMSAILHDWDDASAAAILQTLRTAMRSP